MIEILPQAVARARGYRSNDITSGIIHLIGCGLAIAVLVLLMVFGARYGSAWHVVSYALYGAGLIVLYFASASYHLIPHHWPRAKRRFRHFDHAVIYVLIAATYTPVTFISLSGGWRWSMFGVIWGLAAAGFISKLFGVRIPMPLATALYLLMGWLIILAFAPLRQQMTPGTLWLLFTGGLAYTIGVIFFALDHVLKRRKYFWMHEIFHVFVLGGSALHTIMMFFLLQA